MWNIDRRMQLFRLKVLSIQKDFISLPLDSALCRFFDILNSEAPCFILTKREPENFPAWQRAELKAENVVQLFPRILARTSVIFRFQGFSGPPLQNIGAKSAPQCIELKT